VLETLGPTERAVFVLREVFEFPYEEIAEAVDKTPAAVRQIVHRAREHVSARQPRVQVDPGEQQAVVERFVAALDSGDMQGLFDVLAPDVVAVADGGGVVAAARRPVMGAEPVASLLTRFSKAAPSARLTMVWINGTTAVRVDQDGELRGAVSLVVEAGRITHIFAVANPEKLTRLGEEMRLSRRV
jgi:RNA polymerase sigma-70 factor (ECF subfamily)